MRDSLPDGVGEFDADTLSGRDRCRDDMVEQIAGGDRGRQHRQ